MFRSQWRTIIILAFLGVLDLIGLGIALWRDSAMAQQMFASYSWSLVSMAIAASGKAAIEHAANGSGLQGAAMSILTDLKPGESASKP